MEGECIEGPARQEEALYVLCGAYNNWLSDRVAVSDDG